MQHMENNASDAGNHRAVKESYALAIIAECLYLTNLLFFPGLAFVVLSLLYVTNRNHPSVVVRCHLKQTFVASIWAGVMIVLVSLSIIFIGDFSEPGTWVVAILYFTSVHATLVFMGAFGLSRAINGQHYHFHLIGPACPAGD